ncbi:Ger(x)C family spore germination protein [Paenibacillus oryzisoli]|uniref:Ger(x)C family spore germination protein n=1 Tax=Paenibacillus oryzisoli TaxID=1850517 RepID=UPI003D27CFD0
MRKQVMLFTVCFMMMIVLSGCWSRHELNDLAIAVGMGFDKKEDGIQVTVQIVNPGEVASKRGAPGFTTPVSSFKTTSRTIFEALRKLTTQSPRKIYSSHLRVLVISEELARDGIMPILDGISRNHEMRADFYIMVAREATAENVLNTLTSIEKIPANKLFSTLEMSAKVWAPTVEVRLAKLINDLQTEGKDPVLSGVVIKGDPSKGVKKSNVSRIAAATVLENSGLAVFKNDKLIGWLNERESKGYNYVIDNVVRTAGEISCPSGGVIAIEVVRTKTKMRGVVVNNEPRILLDVFLDENVGEVQCKIDLMEPQTIAELEQIAEREVNNIIESVLQKARTFKVDIFGFGDAIYRANPKYWNEHHQSWQEQFFNLPVDVHTKVKIRRVGTVTDPLVQRAKE